MPGRQSWAGVAEERRLRALLEFASDVLLVLDRRGRLVFAVPDAILGHEVADLRHGQFVHLIHPDDLQPAMAFLAEIAATSDARAELECRVRHADGSWRWMHVRGTNRVDDPDVDGVIVNALDVTREREAEVIARRSDERLRSLVENATDLTIVCDARGVPRYVTPSVERTLGLTLDDISAGERFHTEFVHPDDLPALVATFESARGEEGRAAPVEFRSQDRAGVWRVLQGTVTHLLHDPAVAGIVINVRDVTDRTRAEAALRRSEQRWRMLCEHSSDLINLFDAQGQMTFASNSGPVLGYDAQLDRDPAWAFDLVHPADRDKAVEMFTTLMSRPGPVGPVVTRVVHADGTWRWIESIGTNLLDDADIDCIIVSTRDITARKNAEDDLRDQTRFVETLHGVGQTLSAELDLDRLVHSVTQAAVEVSGATFGVFVGGDELAVTARWGDMPADHLFPPDVMAPVLQGEGPLRTDEVLAVPVLSRRGEVLGALLCGGPEVGAFSERGERMLLGIASHAAVALDNARLYHAAQSEISARKQVEAELAHAATHDPLTGLPNRALFLDRLAMALGRAERQPGAAGVLLFDLDRFKVVNDSLGHAAGDHLLIEVSDRLRQIVRPGDTVARLGGDEFIMVCEDLNGEIDAIGIADRVAETLSPPFRLEEAEVTMSASVGIAVASTPGLEPASLVRDADAAMYRAKERGRNRWELFDESLRTRAVQRLNLENDLRRAIERDELRLHFQPIVALATGAVIGAEALVRWERPDVGLVSPGEFIRVAEETGLVAPVGEWVVAETCRHMRAGVLESAAGPLTASINVSARQLVQRDMLHAIKSAIIDAVDPRRICIEITESALMEDVESAVAGLEELRSLGMTLWVDDFGTGYSSLAYLRRLPIDGLKIDRSFVAGLSKGAEDSAIAAGVVGLAHSLELLAVAEGVETVDQLDRLRGLGCDLAQGYYWTPPLPPSDLGDWLAAP
jgi:diguanylate cyclase (GGDEF)-like protein/PAS domain S-box-containing protein